MPHSRLFPLAFATLLASCASLAENSLQPSAVTEVPDIRILAAIADAATPFDKDRLAILGMQGEFRVSFDFVETVVLAPDYQRRKSKTTGAYETVLLLEDAGRRIVLQHLLVSEDGGHVTKHWRQDWHYEAPSRLEFSEDQTWRLKPLRPEQTRGAWTQCVYEVSDAPRYCGTGQWIHRDGVSTWTSDHTWRPLPRREYTQRSDYNALSAVNRHTLTPSGWTHEQDNTKTVREGERSVRALVREFGFNDYRRISGFDFSPARAYWNATQGYWAQVRELWQRRIVEGEGICLKTKIDGMDLIAPLFMQAQDVQDGKPVEAAAISALFDRWTAPAAEAVSVVK
jgi:hypothetical protein